MGQATGAVSKIIIGFENVAYGTAATAGFDIPFISSGLRLNRPRTTDPVIRSNFNPSKPSKDNQTVGGTIVVPFDSIASWYWMKSAFNTLATSGAASPYTHTFTNKAVTARTSLTIEHQYLDLATPKYYQYTGCKIGSMSLTTGTTGLLMLNIEVVAQDRTIADTSFDGTPTAVDYAPIEQSHASLKEGGVAFADATNVAWNINFNLDTGQYAIGGGGAVDALHDQIMDVSGSLTALYKDTDLGVKAGADTESSLEVTYQASASSQVIVEVEELQYHENDPAIEGPQGIQQSLDYTGYYDDGINESAVMVTLINTEAHA